MNEPESEFAERLTRLDPTLWAGVVSSASATDRRTLLALQREARRPGYAYAEIGSERGGSLQAHLADPWCARAFSIDLRVSEADDTRGRRSWYEGNTTARMRAELERAQPGCTGKLTTFDAAARDVPPEALEPRPTVVFIDAEHTDRAAKADFDWALAAVRNDGWIAFHDATLVAGAIRRALQELRRAGRAHAGGVAAGRRVCHRARRGRASAAGAVARSGARRIAAPPRDGGADDEPLVLRADDATDALAAAALSAAGVLAENQTMKNRMRWTPESLVLFKDVLTGAAHEESA